ncbi:hypothetical protein ACFV4P_33980 [Kitasatospora sp. NPDC059795]|uniref:hypothetical protein n=1 Tax=Kitasatospora sp. NPDC059795 TaxID=3346949 RepID=UPI0036594069
MSAEQERPRLVPTGTCWCGCGAEAAIGAFFARGHDKIAEAALLAVRFDGSVPRLLHEHGFGPARSVTDEAVRQGMWHACPTDGCDYKGAPAGLRLHLKKPHH